MPRAVLGPVLGAEQARAGSPAVARHLSVPTGGAAVSTQMCIDRPFPSFRFLARNAGSVKAHLQVEIVWQESGVKKTSKVALDKKAGTTWTPVKSLKLPMALRGRSRSDPLANAYASQRDARSVCGGEWRTIM